jgi:hypothetical protein
VSKQETSKVKETTKAETTKAETNKAETNKAETNKAKDASVNDTEQIKTQPEKGPAQETETMTKQDATNELFRSMTTYFEPWARAVKSWNTESEKLHQTTIETMTKVLDNSHRLTKEGLDMMANMSATVQRQVTAQVERTVDMMGSIVQ